MKRMMALASTFSWPWSAWPRHMRRQRRRQPVVGRADTDHQRPPDDGHGRGVGWRGNRRLNGLSTPMRSSPPSGQKPRQRRAFRRHDRRSGRRVAPRPTTPSSRRWSAQSGPLAWATRSTPAPSSPSSRRPTAHSPPFDPGDTASALADPEGLLTQVLGFHVVPKQLSPGRAGPPCRAAHVHRRTPCRSPWKSDTVSSTAARHPWSSPSIQIANTTVYLIDAVMVSQRLTTNVGSLSPPSAR